MKQILKISKDLFEDCISIINEDSDNFFNSYKPKDIIYVDELNFIDCSGYTVINGVYKFYNRKTMFIYMHDYGITCGCERRLINSRVQLCYNGQPMTKEQYNYLSKRVNMLEYTKYNKGCGCVKNKR
jgi:hypothetical protein